MPRMLGVVVAVGVALLDGCASAVGPEPPPDSGGSIAGDDSGSFGDAIVVGDGVTGEDALPAGDGLSQGDGSVFDVPVLDGAPPPPDSPSSFDVPGLDGAPPPTDVPISPPPSDVIENDAPTSLAGRWRAVRFQTTNASGVTTVFTDADSIVTVGSFSVLGRTNGMLFLSDQHLSESFGLLLNDQFFSSDTAATISAAYSTYGIAAPGTLSGDVFDLPGGSNVTYSMNSDGTITQVDASSGNATTWASTTEPLGSASIDVQAQAQLWRASQSTAFAHPRVALGWDLPGPSPVEQFTNDQPIAFGPLNTALYNVVVSAPPAAAVVLFGSTGVALAYVIVYDDTNDNAAYDESSDILRGVSPIAIGYRVGNSSPQFAASDFENLDEGFQVVHLQPDYSTLRTTVAPFDATHPVPPDVLVDVGQTGTPIPDLLH